MCIYIYTRRYAFICRNWNTCKKLTYIRAYTPSNKSSPSAQKGGRARNTPLAPTSSRDPLPRNPPPSVKTNHARAVPWSEEDSKKPQPTRLD